MLLDEYDYNLDMEAKKEDGRQEKAVEAARNALAMNLSPEQVVQITGLPLDQVLELQKELAAHLAPAN